MRALLLSILFGSVLIGSAAADTMEQWQVRLEKYIAANSFIKPGKEKPQILFLRQEYMQKIYDANPVQTGVTVLGLTHNNMIVLPIGFDPNVQPEILLHEMYHFYVGITEQRGRFACAAAEEALAYELQNKFVDEERGGQGIKGGDFYRTVGCLHPQ